MNERSPQYYGFFFNQVKALLKIIKEFAGSTEHYTSLQVLGQAYLANLIIVEPRRNAKILSYAVFLRPMSAS